MIRSFCIIFCCLLGVCFLFFSKKCLFFIVWTGVCLVKGVFKDVCFEKNKINRCHLCYKIYLPLGALKRIYLYTRAVLNRHVFWTVW
ncbi:hypothetical protein COU62_04265 [Candidatus Pacearchaeota archaeon CG10_big_fil_rev_8_21_14_0_10_35_219]|nr:MAG: hypothetical protein AUJ63_02910 [Candidatus Pacearchaeota archaeon CG1_02_35_32]PIO07325.1 MAG: hypothetical protein COU62_04265 [Candidatus Pacearchaeota archaeon CG10_big_fil_rev_8_21_14_0_10_35_219]PIY81375.1 MAG: hypothetical protein COY79_03810 [Candidatus Pacearchaeota archaeon CG_4_10_14_0_8_um_filter_35_169]PIZ79831.1 MAG: hypothetical protein COY00_03315 [Candidatus Pacearchaeota archaeon CG_4_10_14_0_2_um_filter_35_33]PJA69853.1 MAG: hypothetical protein CO155_03220 [Candidat